MKHFILLILVTIGSLPILYSCKTGKGFKEKTGSLKNLPVRRFVSKVRSIPSLQNAHWCSTKGKPSAKKRRYGSPRKKRVHFTSKEKRNYLKNLRIKIKRKRFMHMSPKFLARLKAKIKKTKENYEKYRKECIGLKDTNPHTKLSKCIDVKSKHILQN